jgi:hypothetical protein
MKLFNLMADADIDCVNIRIITVLTQFFVGDKDVFVW